MRPSDLDYLGKGKPTMWMRALNDCYIDQIRREGEEFEYSGPENGNLEPADEPEPAQKAEPAQKPARKR